MERLRCNYAEYLATPQFVIDDIMCVMTAERQVVAERSQMAQQGKAPL